MDLLQQTHPSEPQTRPSEVSREQERQESGNGALPRPSLWLYAAGLCVTLSGLYAVNWGSADVSFTMLTFGFAICGYLFSYVTRARRISLQSMHTPMLVVLALAVLAMLSSERGLAWLAPMGVEDDRAKILQYIFAWLAIAHSFLLANDAAVLFACVPCMTMLALVSTHNSDPDVQNAFLVFIGASTFMMVHENYLRTRTAQAQGRSLGPDRRLFGGQLQLTALCLVAALILANFVALPIRTLGQTLFDNGVIQPVTTRIPAVKNLAAAITGAGEQSKISVGNGPVSESDTEILRVECKVPNLYWRGKTFATYTGDGFNNYGLERREVAVHSDQGDGADQNLPTREFRSSSDSSYQGLHRFDVEQSPLDPVPTSRAAYQEVTQRVIVKAGNVTDLYAAGSVERVVTSLPRFSAYVDGNVHALDPLSADASYTITSRVPIQDDKRLRSISDAPDRVPEPIRGFYLESRSWDEKSQQWRPTDPGLRALAEKITRGKTNNYDRARAIMDYLASECRYNLKAEAVPAGQDVVNYFLTVSHQGYCTDFGAAMTMLCRYVGIPARLASGFLTGDPGPDGYSVRDRHKHVWTEVFFPGVGWVPFDPTTNTIDITDRSSRSRQQPPSFAAWFFSHGWLPPLLGLVVLGLLGYLFKAEILDRMGWGRRLQRGLLDRPPTNVAVVTTYLQACALLGRHGLTRREMQTPDEFAALVRERMVGNTSEIAATFTLLTHLYTTARYGAGVATNAEVAAARQWLESLKLALRDLPRAEPTVRSLRLRASG